MPLKKDLVLSSALVLISGWLLIAARGNSTSPAPVKKLHTPCCTIDKSVKPASPWNFMTESFLHFSV